MRRRRRRRGRRCFETATLLRIIIIISATNWIVNKKLPSKLRFCPFAVRSEHK